MKGLENETFFHYQISYSAITVYEIEPWRNNTYDGFVKKMSTHYFLPAFDFFTVEREDGKRQMCK